MAGNNKLTTIGRWKLGKINREWPAGEYEGKGQSHLIHNRRGDRGMVFVDFPVHLLPVNGDIGIGVANEDDIGIDLGHPMGIPPIEGEDVGINGGDIPPIEGGAGIVDLDLPQVVNVHSIDIPPIEGSTTGALPLSSSLIADNFDEFETLISMGKDSTEAFAKFSGIEVCMMVKQKVSQIIVKHDCGKIIAEDLMDLLRAILNFTNLFYSNGNFKDPSCIDQLLCLSEALSHLLSLKFASDMEIILKEKLQEELYKCKSVFLKLCDDAIELSKSSRSLDEDTMNQIEALKFLRKAFEVDAEDKSFLTTKGAGNMVSDKWTDLSPEETEFLLKYEWEKVKDAAFLTVDEIIEFVVKVIHRVLDEADFGSNEEEIVEYIGKMAGFILKLKKKGVQPDAPG